MKNASNKENNKEIQTDNTPRKPLYQCDEFSTSMIRRVTQDFYSRKEYPSVNSLWQTCRNNEYFPKISESLFRKWLVTKCSFKYRLINKKPVYLERTDIVAQRENYLRKIRQYRAENRKIYFSDETWASPDNTRKYCWEMLLTNRERQEMDQFWSGMILQDMNNWTGGFLVKSGNGRVIINHIGSEDGFLTDGDDIFISKKDVKDYHGNMDHVRYLTWFEKILSLVPPKSVLVLDQAPYHRKRVEGTLMPNMAWLKQKIVDWVVQHDIRLPEGVESFHKLTKSSLIELAKSKPVKPKFIVEKLAEESNKDIKILWLPPAHCEFNPIELIWAIVKGYIAKHNPGNNLNGIYELSKKAVSNITPEMWRNCVHHSIKYEDKMWERDRLMDNFLDSPATNLMTPIIIPIREDDSSDSEYHTESDDLESEDGDLEFFDS
ncbi:hypothetical protein Fcan01_18959 [Folsomia candida]|uniref:Uncharacterized protein n=2 Tax=Folsomia candida TaxID=158441 RepID=A0A226DLU7_FOLCA|nr:hypothetical protein Fcan01_18959 [Folsomia candida]